MAMIKDEKFEQNGFVFDISYISDRGGRITNEDSTAVRQEKKRILLAVADGLGAHGGGDVASSTAIEVVKEEYTKPSKPNRKNIHNIFQTVDNAIVAVQTDSIKMKTTLSCVLCDRKRIFAAHLGDTRIYTLDGNGKMHITADHTLAYEEMMNNGGTLNDIRQNPNRHILKAALGVGTIKPPDMFKQKIKNNLSVLICSDGFWEYVCEDDIANAVKNTVTARAWLEAMLKCHSERIDNYNDNYSAICLRIIQNRRL